VTSFWREAIFAGFQAAFSWRFRVRARFDRLPSAARPSALCLQACTLPQANVTTCCSWKGARFRGRSSAGWFRLGVVACDGCARHQPRSSTTKAAVFACHTMFRLRLPLVRLGMPRAVLLGAFLNTPPSRRRRSQQIPSRRWVTMPSLPGSV